MDRTALELALPCQRLGQRCTHRNGHTPPGLPVWPTWFDTPHNPSSGAITSARAITPDGLSGGPLGVMRPVGGSRAKHRIQP